MSSRSFRVLVALLVALGMIGGATAAFADPDYGTPPPPAPPVDEDEVHEPEQPEVEEELEEEPAPEDPVVDEETSVIGVSLPRTGTSVLLLALIGALLVGLGTLLVARRRSQGEPV